MLSVAPVSTKYLSFVNSSFRKINPAFAGKCIAVVVACVGLAAEPKMVQQQASFPTKHRAECTERALTLLLSPLFPLLGAGLLFCCVEAAATVGSWLPRASHRASAAFTMAAAISWVPVPTASLMDGGRWIKEKDHCRVKLLEGDVV